MRQADRLPWWAPESVALRDAAERVLYAIENPYGPGVFVPAMDRTFLLLGLVPMSEFQAEAKKAYQRAVDEFKDAVKEWSGWTSRS